MMSAPIGRKPPLWQSGDDPNGIVYKIVMSADRHMLYRLLRSEPGDKFRQICQVRLDHFGDDEESQQKTLAEFIKIGALCFEGKCDDVYKAREAIFSTVRCGKRPAANTEKKQHGHDERPQAMPKKTTWSASSIDSGSSGGIVVWRGGSGIFKHAWCDLHGRHANVDLGRGGALLPLSCACCAKRLCLQARSLASVLILEGSQVTCLWRHRVKNPRAFKITRSGLASTATCDSSTSHESWTHRSQVFECDSSTSYESCTHFFRADARSCPSLAIVGDM